MLVEHNLRLVRAVADRARPSPRAASSRRARWTRSRSDAVRRTLPGRRASLDCAGAGCGRHPRGGAPRGRLRRVERRRSAPTAHRLRERPVLGAPYVGETIARGAELGAAAVNEQRPRHRRQSTSSDRAGRQPASPRSAVANVRRAVEDGARRRRSTRARASTRPGGSPADADIPVGVVYQGGVDLVDPEERPNVFRIAPTDHGIAFRLAEYLIPKGLKIALLTDDSGYGQAGGEALEQAFGRTRRPSPPGSSCRRRHATSPRRSSGRAVQGRRRSSSGPSRR